MTEMDTLLNLMFRAFSDEPFHTLSMVFGASLGTQVKGGTCSDKTLLFIDVAKKYGLKARLWTAFIGGKEIHRLASVEIDGRQHFADVGNGWPSIKPYPADTSIRFQAYGMTFRTVLHPDRLSVYHKKEDYEYHQMDIMLAERPEDDVRSEVEARFTSGIVYPFDNRLRFSAIVERDFKFLRDSTLYIYSDKGLKHTIPVFRDSLEETILQHFGFSTDLSNRGLT
jgi:arylamine N-acetyltransferase